MKIAYITAGAAGMYCGSCLHDNTLAKALIALGHDVSLIPTYTPIRTDEDDVSIDRVFYGAVNVYLEQKTSVFRHTPRVLDRLFDSPRLVQWARSRGASTDAKDLGELTLSVLMGEEGNQSKELERLVCWLKDDLKPEVVHLTNSMFLGLARRLRAELKVPVLCSVQGEDLFFDEMVEPFKSRVRDVLRERARDVDGFVATSRYYADYMTDLLDVAPERMHHVALGVNLDGFDGPADKGEASPFVVAYLARLCPEKGLHIAVDAFRRLAESKGRERVRLHIAGYLDPKDRDYFDGILREVRDWGLDGVVDHWGEVDRARKVELLGTAHVLSVPTVYREPKGLFVLESLACGTPVVQPRHGAFPEMLERTGGGLLVEPGDAAELATVIERLMDDTKTREQAGGSRSRGGAARVQ